MFDGKTEGIKLLLSGLLTAFINTFGVHHKYIVAIVVLMTIDTMLGWLKAKKNGMWSSKIARWGFAGKVVEITIIGIMAMMDWVFGTNFILMDIAICYYAIVEIASIVENINDGKLAELPDGLTDALSKLKYSAGKSVVNKLKEVIATVIGTNLNIDKDDIKPKNKEGKNE